MPPIASSELIFYGAANHAEDDTSTQGGAISLTTKPAFTAMAANDTLDVLSSSASDTTQTVTITGRLASGAIDSEAYSLSGTTPQTGAKTFERVLKIVMSATAVGTVTVRRSSSGPTVATLEPGFTTVRRLGYASGSDPGSARDVYEKVFVKNTNGSLSLTAGKVDLTVEPSAASDCQIALATTVDDTGTATNRLTAPSGVGTFVGISTDINLPGDTNLDAGEAIAVWVKMVLAAGNAEFKDDVQIRLRGNTT